MEDYLTDKEACRYMHISRTTLWRLRQKGVVTVRYLGDRPRYQMDELRNCMSEVRR